MDTENDLKLEILHYNTLGQMYLSNGIAILMEILQFYISIKQIRLINHYKPDLLIVPILHNPKHLCTPCTYFLILNL